jgi:hypothetical protein
MVHPPKPITILAEINSVAWAEVDLIFRYAFTNGLNRGRVATGKAFQSHGDFGRGCHIEAVKTTSCIRCGH